MMSSLDDNTAAFYDHIADKYASIEQDWDTWLEFNRNSLQQLIAEYCPHAKTALDCAAGIGSQAIALERLGFDVTATDLSSLSLKQIRAYSAMPTHKVSWSDLPVFFHDQRFDIIVCLDNAIGHSRDFSQLRDSTGAMLALLSDVPNASLFMSTRDFDSFGDTPPNGFPYDQNARQSYYQLWEWTSQDNYISTWYINGVRQKSTMMRRILRAELFEIARTLGAEIMECRDVYTQPVYRFTKGVIRK